MPIFNPRTLKWN